MVFESRQNWLRGPDLNRRPSGYEPDELPGCSIPQKQSMKYWAQSQGSYYLFLSCCKYMRNLKLAYDNHFHTLTKARNRGRLQLFNRENSMAKLYFRYGTVGSAKTLNLLAVAHNYQQQGKKVLLIKPALDIRFGRALIKSRAGLAKEAHMLIEEGQRIVLPTEPIDCILVDEAQFLSSEQIEDLQKIASLGGIPVICYGLRADFKSECFEGSKRLLELSDSIEEVKTTCNFCDRKAIFNLKFIDNKATKTGPQVDLGAEEKYLPACSKCYHDFLESNKELSPSKTDLSL